MPVISDMELREQQRREVKAIRFEHLRDKKPVSGDILTSKDGEYVPVYVETYPLDNGIKKKTFFTTVAIDDESTGWYLTSSNRGLKVLIMPRSQTKLIEMNDGSEDKLFVQCLRVVRYNQAGTAVLCELLDWY